MIMIMIMIMIIIIAIIIIIIIIMKYDDTEDEAPLMFVLPRGESSPHWGASWSVNHHHCHHNCCHFHHNCCHFHHHHHHIHHRKYTRASQIKSLVTILSKSDKI